MNRILEVLFLACGLIFALPPVAAFALNSMFGQMLFQIPLIFGAATIPGYCLGARSSRAWRQWNLEGVPGLLLATLTLTFWMIPIALDHAASDSSWEASKIVSLIVAGVIAGISWTASSTVARAFFLGNLLWMTATVGLLYQEYPQRLCNAYLWEDQSLTGEALVGVSVVVGLIWMLRFFPWSSTSVSQRDPSAPLPTPSRSSSSSSATEVTPGT
jgi:hypothetical protein